jgi:hypothetical protein
MMAEYDERAMSRANVWACAYNAAVNYGSERANKKMWDLIRALNDDMRLDGKAKMDELVDLGIIDSYTECSPECCMRPGGLFHADGCPNESNTEFMREIESKTREQLPEPQRAKFISINLVGRGRDRRLAIVLPYVQPHEHRDPIGNLLTCKQAGCTDDA